MHHYKACYIKEGDMRFISHLDLLRTFIRALRRSGIPVIYSQGFNPQPRLIFAAPLAVGMEGKNEYLDLFLSKPWEEEELKAAFNRQFPAGLRIKKIEKVANGASPTFSSVLGAALYVAELSSPYPELLQALKDILQKDTLIKVRHNRKHDKNGKKIDIRPFIYDLKVKEDNGKAALLMLLATGSKGGVKPQEVLELLPLEGNIKICRQDLFLREGNRLKTPCGFKPEDYLEESFLLR